MNALEGYILGWTARNPDGVQQIQSSVTNALYNAAIPNHAADWENVANLVSSSRPLNFGPT